MAERNRQNVVHALYLQLYL